MNPLGKLAERKCLILKIGRGVRRGKVFSLSDDANVVGPGTGTLTNNEQSVVFLAFNPPYTSELPDNGNSFEA